MSDQLHISATLPPGKESQVPTGWDARLVPAGLVKEKNSLRLPGIEPRPSSP